MPRAQSTKLREYVARGFRDSDMREGNGKHPQNECKRRHIATKPPGTRTNAGEQESDLAAQYTVETTAAAACRLGRWDFVCSRWVRRCS
jgi:hypothetical protein